LVVRVLPPIAVEAAVTLAAFNVCSLAG